MTRGKRIISWVIGILIVLYIGLVIVASLPQDSVPAKSLAKQGDKFVNIKGKEIRYVKQGEGEKTIILVHGFGCSIYSWRHVIPLLSDKYTVYAFDLPGFGLSDKSPSGNYDLKSQGSFVIDFMDALNIYSATLVGHSMGGVVVGYAAVEAPERIEKVVLNDAGFYSGGAPSFLKYLFYPLNKLSAMQFYNKSFVKKLHMGMFYNKELVTDELVDEYLIAGKTPDAVEVMSKMMTDVEPQQYTGISEHITAPTLIVWGEFDPGMPLSDAERLRSEIKNSLPVIVIKNAGHMVPDEKPEELAKVIKEFVG
ncbi:MAG: alpha/beta hydrolase [Candidatus Schekmanbacteria bacterium]|nr:alpha/beta hydrolase [Candidatus Schekmanbacteria bacterium]